MPDPTCLAYTDAVETPQPDEAALGDAIVAAMGRVNARTFERHRHGLRDAHAKSHGLLKGTLEVYADLPAALAQGLFAKPKAYPLVARLSTAPSDIHHDNVPAPRGLALKVIGVEGRKVLAGMEDAATQDFLLVNAPTIPFGDVAAYAKAQEKLSAFAEAPELLQRAAAALARGAEAVLETLGAENAAIAALAVPNTHILGETFYSMAALRHGGFIAKICVRPLSAGVRELTGAPIGDDYSALREGVVDFFRQTGAEYEICAQLCTDLARMPVEDASVEWPQDVSAYIPVGKIGFPRQDADSPARRQYFDDVLSFSPWHCLPEHRPLGSIMRVRIKAYEASSAYRHRMNHQPRLEPKAIGDVPD